VEAKRTSFSSLSFADARLGEEEDLSSSPTRAAVEAKRTSFSSLSFADARLGEEEDLSSSPMKDEEEDLSSSPTFFFWLRASEFVFRQNRNDGRLRARRYFLQSPLSLLPPLLASLAPGGNGRGFQWVPGKW